MSNHIMRKTSADTNFVPPSTLPALHAVHCKLQQPKQECRPLLLESGASIDAQDQNGATALFIAAQYGEASLVRYLLSRKADVTPRDIR